MADVHSKAVRSFNMSRIKSKDTKPELIVRSFLHNAGLRFRIHRKDIPGKPDLVFPKYKAAVFIHGCFWHCHQNCSRAVLPKSKKDYWLPKLSRNVERDKINIEKLNQSGWKIIVVWECELKKSKREETLETLFKSIISS